MASILALDEVVVEFVEGRRVLDVACGRGKWGHLVRIYRDWPRRGKSIRCSSALDSIKIVGVDLSRQELSEVRNIYDAIIECDGVCLPFRDNSFDTVIAAEVIEHIPKPRALRLMSECERVANRVVIISTPPPRTVRMSPEHISSWKPSDFRRIGYRVYGVRSYPLFASDNIVVQSLIAFIMGPLSYWFPELSSDMIAVKFLQGDTSVGVRSKAA